MGQLYLSLLGSPEIRHQEQVLKFRTRKELALLVYLVVEGGMHSRDKLMALFWPDFDEMRGRAILRRTLVLLRRLLEETTTASHETHLVVERNALGIRRTSFVASDVSLLEATFSHVQSQPSLNKVQGDERSLLVSKLQETLHQVRGVFLDDFFLPDAPAFDTWVSMQREAIRRRLSSLFDFLSLLHMDGGEIPDAMMTATRWVAYDPGNEVATRRLMQLYFIIGKREEALRVYETTRAWLSRELNVEPSPETIALAERLRGEQPSYLIDQQRSLRRFSVSSIPLDTSLVGRAEEYASLVESYHGALHRETRLVLIEGEAGVGKTRLVTDFLRWASAQGADVLHGRAFVNGSRLAYQVMVDALRRRMEQENAPDDLLSDIWLSELSRILPELRDRYPDLPVPLIDEATGHVRLFEAVVRLGHAWALRRPLVLFLDDLQWADPSSRDLLYYALQQWRESRLPVLLIASVRAEVFLTPPDLQAWLFSLKHAVPTLALALEALRYEDILQWVQNLNEHTLCKENEKITNQTNSNLTPFARWLFNKTQGLPLYVEELFRALLERQMLRAVSCPDGTWAIDMSVTDSEIAQWHNILPSRIQDTIRMRLTHISSIARILLCAASVLCHDFTFEQLCQVAELSDNDALQALDDLLCHHLLIKQVNNASPVDEATYSFSHDTLREVVSIEPGERRRVFQQRALQLQRLQIPVVPASDLAHHALA